LALTTAVDIAKPICQAQRAATGSRRHDNENTGFVFNLRESA
jgi:hypothetical protein